jgi:DNA-directed RNA polymerase specialized sigma24 family protein
VTGTRHPRSSDQFEELYKATRGDILSYLLRRSPTTEDAADALAETYLTAWQGSMWFRKVMQRACGCSVSPAMYF